MKPKTILVRLMKKSSMKQIELYIDNVIANGEIGDEIDWLLDLKTLSTSGDELVDCYSAEIESYTFLLLTLITEENYKFCAKVRDAIEIITTDVIRLMKMKDLDEDEKNELLEEIQFIYNVYKLTLHKLVDEFI